MRLAGKLSNRVWPKVTAAVGRGYSGVCPRNRPSVYGAPQPTVLATNPESTMIRYRTAPVLLTLAAETGGAAMAVWKDAPADFFLTADGQIACIHDKDTMRVAGVDKKVKDLTLRELRALDVGSWRHKKYKGTKIPTIAEVLADPDRCRFDRRYG